MHTILFQVQNRVLVNPENQKINISICVKHCASKFFFSKPLEGLVVYFDYMNCMRFSSLPFAYILPFIVKKNSRIIYVRENLKILYIQQFSNETMMVSSSGSILVSLK